MLDRSKDRIVLGSRTSDSQEAKADCLLDDTRPHTLEPSPEDTIEYLGVRAMDLIHGIDQIIRDSDLDRSWKVSRCNKANNFFHGTSSDELER